MKDGIIWLAMDTGYKVTRWNPATGTLIDEIELPVARVTCCVFGGDDLDELYVTTGRFGLSASEIAEQKSAGGLFRVKTNVRGVAQAQRWANYGRIRASKLWDWGQ
ncbi:SMP-30/gluconolactonase/LRE family protein [Paenibacillus gyeongsangnamensis]|uniref:SMP-30/gluconolactonase/LRE family protein n=1 Tax=Paenibacillus gyeongsangnamensis TaxID=3388067 RepID=UPI003907EC43